MHARWPRASRESSSAPRRAAFPRSTPARLGPRAGELAAPRRFSHGDNTTSDTRCPFRRRCARMHSKQHILAAAQRVVGDQWLFQVDIRERDGRGGERLPTTRSLYDATASKVRRRSIRDAEARARRINNSHVSSQLQAARVHRGSRLNRARQRAAPGADARWMYGSMRQPASRRRAPP